jgi:hypothetical protein
MSSAMALTRVTGMTNKHSMATPKSPDDRPDGLLAWQWASYAAAHGNRRNLLIHALTNPLFLLGCLALPASLAFGGWLAPAGVAAIAVAMLAQGRGHAQETTPPAPFRGPMDVVARIVVEQWVTFPRFVLSGSFLAAWRTAGANAR